MLTIIGAIVGWVFNTTIGKYLVGGVALALVGSVLWGGCERSAKLKAEANLATTTRGYRILDEGYLKLYQEREAIKDKASKKRGQINEGTLDDLIGLTNNPGGMRHAVSPNSGGGPKAATVIRDSAGTEFIY